MSNAAVICRLDRCSVSSHMPELGKELLFWLLWEIAAFF